ncbi:hypothetical protein [Thalassotalea sp. PS06]|uniref:hypothetical protein n=1 Tax=Thalassotalea sp. PS06 TaxID=2594005 RepID=UPI001165489E|nr:hypothetical protein [Thalassotalea sp. PS06]QDP02742.1 hypothetical protein FNC98_16160 [Thalassotalea sp. PS06]
MPISRIILSLVFISAPFLVAAEEVNPKSQEELVKNFAEIHQNLMAKVAVADMYYGCHLAKHGDDKGLDDIETLILKTDKDTLGQKLINCLGDDKIGSEKALNFGITGCFTDQTKHMDVKVQSEKMAQVAKAIDALGKEEKQKSFTQCVNNQALIYLQSQE